MPRASSIRPQKRKESRERPQSATEALVFERHRRRLVAPRMCGSGDPHCQHFRLGSVDGAWFQHPKGRRQQNRRQNRQERLKSPRAQSRASPSGIRAKRWLAIAPPSCAPCSATKTNAAIGRARGSRKSLVTLRQIHSDVVHVFPQHRRRPRRKPMPQFPAAPACCSGFRLPTASRFCWWIHAGA